MGLPLTAVELAKVLRGTQRFDSILKKLKILTCANGNIKAELTVEEEHLNPMGGLHGGLSATLVDSVSSFALLSHSKGCVPSVTVDMHVTYLKGAKEGDTIEIDASTVRAGKTLGFLDVFIKNKATGDLLIKGTQTKCFMR